MALLHLGLLMVASLLLLLAGLLAIELVAATIGRVPRTEVQPTTDANFVVVIPAHNEVGTIERTLEAVAGEVSTPASILVVADNCTDETAEVARAAGALVIERRDSTRIGKGYAIEFALKYLLGRPPGTVVLLDADCIPEKGALERLVAVCLATGKPVQARYELETPDKSAGPLARIGTFAWRVKNVLRPTGLKALGVPCLLTGTGMAFPWRAIEAINFEQGHLVEDMVLGLELAAAGRGPVFVPEACVWSAMPPSVEGQTSQRTRWETGHVQVITRHIPQLLLRALAARDVRLVVLLLHAAVPPLALFVSLLVCTAALASLVALTGGGSAAFVTSLLAMVIAGGVFAGYWRAVGRGLLTAQELLQVPGYLASKFTLYARALAGRPLTWTRSKRD